MIVASSRKPSTTLITSIGYFARVPFGKVLRLSTALIIVFVLVTLTNSAPSYFGPFEPLVSQNQVVFVGLALIMVSSVWLWRGGYWRSIQSRGPLALFELAEAGLLLLLLTAFFGLGLNPLNRCLGGGGGFTCYSTTPSFLRGLLDLALIVVGEEIFFVAYLTREFAEVTGVRGAAIYLSTLFYAFFHFPALRVEGFGAVSLLGFLQVLVGTFSLIACYWYTRNLVAVALMHAYWDGVGALVLIPNAGVFSPILLLLGQLSLPAVAIVMTHRFRERYPAWLRPSVRASAAVSQT
jgi:membrane protease YdiL (CAAX protease family)